MKIKSLIPIVVMIITLLSGCDHTCENSDSSVARTGRGFTVANCYSTVSLIVPKKDAITTTGTPYIQTSYFVEKDKMESFYQTIASEVTKMGYQIQRNDVDGLITFRIENLRGEFTIIPQPKSNAGHLFSY